MSTKDQATRLDALARELGLTRRQRALAEGLASADPKTPRWEIARAAGYSGGRGSLDVTASTALKNNKIRKYMAELDLLAQSEVTRRSRSAILGRRAVLLRLSEAASSDIGAHLDRADDGGIKLNEVMSGSGFRLDPEKTRSVRGVEIQETTRQVGDQPVTERRIKLRVGADPAAVSALGLLAKYHKLVDGDERENAKSVQVQVNLLLEQADPQSLRSAVLAELARPR